MKLLSLSGLTLLAITFFCAPRVEAVTTVCTAIWSQPDGVPGGTKSAPIQGTNPPCPASPITVTVGTGSGTGAGTVFQATWDTFLPPINILQHLTLQSLWARLPYRAMT